MRKGNGLYNATYQHHACGVGMVVNIHGNKSHELVDNALKVLENMQHRGAETRDKTGDGAGILLQIPHEFILLQGIPVPEKGKYGTGLVFLPKDKQRQSEILSIMIEETERDGLSLMHLRNVPTNDDVPGISARGVQPDIKQVFITGVKDSDVPVFDDGALTRWFVVTLHFLRPAMKLRQMPWSGELVSMVSVSMSKEHDLLAATATPSAKTISCLPL